MSIWDKDIGSLDSRKGAWKVVQATRGQLHMSTKGHDEDVALEEQWEYKVVDLTDIGGGRWVGQLEKIFGKLGRQGWEFVGMVTNSFGEKMTTFSGPASPKAIFKRRPRQ